MSDTSTEFKIGDRVRVAADADDVYFGGEVEGIVAPDPYPELPVYPEGERRVLVEAYVAHFDLPLTQWVRPEDLTLIND